jgi:hypothetical protein
MKRRDLRWDSSAEDPAANASVKPFAERPTTNECDIHQNLPDHFHQPTRAR